MFSCRSSGCLNPCNVCCYFSNFGYSTSRWCSRGCDEDNHFFPRPCPTPPCPCVSARFAYLVQTAGMTLAAGEPVPFSDASLLGDGFQLANGFLAIRIPGIYRVEYRIHIPQEAAVNTTFVLQLGGVNIPGTAHTISHAVNDPPVNITAHAIIQVPSDTTLALVSLSPVSIPASLTGDALATMTVTGV